MNGQKSSYNKQLKQRQLQKEQQVALLAKFVKLKEQQEQQ